MPREADGGPRSHGEPQGGARDGQGGEGGAACSRTPAAATAGTATPGSGRPAPPAGAGAGAPMEPPADIQHPYNIHTTSIQHPIQHPHESNKI